MSLLKKFLNFRKRLAYKLITYYGFLLITLVTIAFNFNKFDARNFSSLSVKDQTYFKNESIHTQESLNLDEIFENNLSVETANGFDVILQDKKTGTLSGVNQSNIKALQSFIYETSQMDEPQQRRFENSEIYGPFSVISETNTYNQYFIKAVDAQEEWINTILDTPILMVLILMFLGMPLLWWMSFKITQPVQNLTISANAVASGQLETNPKLETEGIYEIREVGKSFNHMVTSLKLLTQHQQRIISDISHELKTPLARLQLALAILRRKTGEVAEIQRIEAEIGKLDQMVKDLLVISRQQLNYQIQKTIFTIDEIWVNVLEDAKFETSQNNIVLIIKQNIKYPAQYSINGAVNSLTSALENLIRNGQKYAKQLLSVSMDIQDENLVLVVEDDGNGVPEHEYENIFKPFYRVDEARARETGGTGLGLAIVQNAVQQHQGHIQVSKSEMGGLKVKLQIPLWTHKE
ncbi:two-component system sensor histidine kinase CpxA [Mannheimia granulomatis]|uniref:envelope stress sensor histidine kinase CpxA n=1 Tax=Mannheimia granulomatis TaxID=85402 RepID=UPI00159E97B0|nr:envelope stress sensor histidine kinase CpxA [Mannheimia granulomatis]QLB14697.1 two-component system sensor histidine kinase CpxA [Mannheimia granulomatis]